MMRLRTLPFIVTVLFVAHILTASPKPSPEPAISVSPSTALPALNNAITDVEGVEVGHTTLISGSGKLKVGEGPVRTGVTAVLPRGKDSHRSGLRRLVHAQRQRRNDRHYLARRVRHSSTARS